MLSRHNLFQISFPWFRFRKNINNTVCLARDTNSSGINYVRTPNNIMSGHQLTHVQVWFLVPTRRIAAGLICESQPASDLESCSSFPKKWYLFSHLFQVLIFENINVKNEGFAEQTQVSCAEQKLMKPQVGCTTLRLVRDNKSIKTIMVPRPSYQTRLNQEHKQAQPRDASFNDSRLLVPQFTAD